MSTYRLLAAVAVLSALTGPAMAQQVIAEPGYCAFFYPNANCQNKRKPSDYLKDQIMVDAMVFSPEGVRHLVAELGVSQVVYGTDIPIYAWPDAVDNILAAQITDAQKEAILGGTLVKLLKL